MEGTCRLGKKPSREDLPEGEAKARHLGQGIKAKVARAVQ